MLILIPVLDLSGVVVNYSGGFTLSSTSFSVSPREVVAITGRSGAGKSTLLYAISGLVPVASGAIRLHGDQVLSTDRAQISRVRRKIGVVFQAATLFDELTVFDNVHWVSRLRGLRGGEARRATTRVLELLDVNDLSTRYPGEISGGEAQRVNIARALVGSVSVLLVDEPTASLDESTSHRVCSQLRQSIDSLGTSAVVVSHDPIVLGYADRQMTMENGTLAGG